MNSLKILFIPFDFMYFLLCCPFRFSKGIEERTGHIYVTTKKSLRQKLPCAFITFLDLLWILYLVRRTLPVPSSDSPRLYINMFGVIISQVGKLVFFKKLWIDEKKILRLPNFIIKIHQEGASEENLRNSRISTSFISLISVLYSSVGFINVARIYGVNRDYEYQNWWGDMVDKGKEIFFLDGIRGENIHVTSALGTVIGALAAVGMLHRFEMLQITIMKLITLVDKGEFYFADDLSVPSRIY